MTTFDKFQNRYIIECDLRSCEDLHVGAGVEGETSDAAFTTRNGVPFIPGSSLRGVLRSTVERMLNAMFSKRVACTLFVDDDPAPGCMAGDEEWRKSIERGDKDAPTPEQYDLCPVCSLFGSTIMAARLKVTDAIQTADNPRQTEVRDGVGIDRDTGSARENIKFNFDVLAPKVDFRFKLIVENMENNDLALLYLMLAELTRGLAVGGKKSRGMGGVKLITYRVERLDPAALPGFYANGVIPTEKREDFHTLASAAFDAFTARNK